MKQLAFSIGIGLMLISVGFLYYEVFLLCREVDRLKRRMHYRNRIDL